MKFHCERCGECCEKVGTVLLKKNEAPEPYKTLLEEFPYKADGDGCCEMYIDGKCSVYDNRPLICNIEKMRKAHFSKTYSKKNYYKVQKEACKQLKQM